MAFIAWDLRWPPTQTFTTWVQSWLHQTRYAIKSTLNLANLPASAAFLLLTIRTTHSTHSLSQLKLMAMPGAIPKTMITHTGTRRMTMNGLMLSLRKSNLSEINSRQTKRLKPLGRCKRLISNMLLSSRSSLTKNSQLNQMWPLRLPLVSLMLLITAVPQCLLIPSLHLSNNPQISVLMSNSQMLLKLLIFAVTCS